MMKRIFMVLSLILAFCMIFSLVACGNVTPPPACEDHIDENGDGICDNDGCDATVEVTPGSEFFNENGELILYKNGVPTFQIVSGAGYSGSSVINDLAKTLSDLSKSDVKVAKATDTDKIQDVEIIIGTVTNRGDEYKFDIHTLGIQGYAVKQVGTKIFVVAGSENYYDPAIQYLKTTVFGITRTTPPFTDLVMSADKNREKPQDNYNVKDITLEGASIRGYTLVYADNSTPAKRAVDILNKSLYEKCGIWLEVERESKFTNDTPYIKFSTIENDGEGGGFYLNIDNDKNVTIECEYANKFESLTERYFNGKVFADNIRGIVALKDDSPDYRNVYYEDYEAVGDGKTDDFFAIKAAHDDANENKLIVHANPDATYFIGSANGTKSIIVKTDTYWHGCKFIFDDRDIISYGSGSGGRTTPIFLLSSDTNAKEYSQSDITNTLGITSLEGGQKNIGWAPGAPMMLIIYNSNVRQYIRVGANENSGNVQHELIIVDADGNVDDTTPIQWDYDVITSITAINIEDTPIVIDGKGENGEYALITTKYNTGYSAPIYFERNIMVKRSNVTIRGIEHIFTDWTPYDEGGGASPYHGIVRVENANNVLIEDMLYEGPEVYCFVDTVPGYSAQPTNANIGSYSISAECSNNVTWRNSRQSNFFREDGSRKQAGAMGTNYCKNLYFEDMFFSAFDAHCGVYNGTLKNCTVDHINFIGDGKIILEDITLYVGTNINGSLNAGINLRHDYGSTWAGDVDIDGLILKYGENYGDGKNSPLCIFYAYGTGFHNHYFGYTCYLPQNITLKNILTERISYSVSGNGNGTNNRQEGHIAYNDLPVYVFSPKFGDSTDDFTHKTFGVTGSNAVTNKNPLKATLSITHYTAYTREYKDLDIKTPLSLQMPTSPTFNKTEKNVITEEE